MTEGVGVPCVGDACMCRRTPSAFGTSPCEGEEKRGPKPVCVWAMTGGKEHPYLLAHFVAGEAGDFDSLSDGGDDVVDAVGDGLGGVLDELLVEQGDGLGVGVVGDVIGGDGGGIH